MGVMAVVVLSGWSFVRERRVKQLVLPMLALGPALLLYAVFHWRNRNGGAVEYASPGERLKFLVTLNVVRSFGGGLEGMAVWLLLLVMVGTILMAVRRNLRGRGSNSTGLFAVLVTSLVVYAIAPDASAGGSYITLRLSLFSFLIALVWVAGMELPLLVRRVIPVAAAVSTFMLTAAHVRAYREIEPALLEFCSVADQIRPGSTILPVIDEGAFPGRVRVLHNATGSLAARRDLVNLRNYEAALNYFPVRYRGGVDVERHSAADYVLVCPGDRSGAVDERYVPVYRSATGLVVLYARRDLGITSRGH
jgi:hypothetical protein